MKKLGAGKFGVLYFESLSRTWKKVFESNTLNK